MRTAMKAVMVCVLAAGAALAAPAGVAVADPGDPEESFVLDCGADGVFDAVTGDGMGEFTPAFDTRSNKVLVPVQFGAFSGTITGEGIDPITFTDPAGPAKGSGKQHNLVTCVYTFTEEFTVTAADAGDPEDPEYLAPGDYLFVGGGTVIGQIRGR